MTTLRPLGPRVTLTALLRISMPRNMRSRASEEKRSSLAAIVNSRPEFKYLLNVAVRPCSCDDAQNIALLHDEELMSVDRDLGARPFAEQHLVAGLDVERRELAGFIPAARTDGNN